MCAVKSNVRLPPDPKGFGKPLGSSVGAHLRPACYAFYLGMYGGKEYEGVWPEDEYEPERFFCFHTKTLRVFKTISKA
jgi:hypothetical protein